MIVDTIDHLADFAPLIEAPIYDRIRLFLAATSHPPHGAMETLGGPELLVRVLRLETKVREDCRYETHKEYTDLQCIRGGGELIDWTLQGGLRRVGEYDPTHDVSFYETREPTATLQMKSGMFVIFRSHDAHRPQIAAPGYQWVDKFVFKIHNSQFRRHQ